ncbi:tetratricopeptide repeat protein [Flavobacteriaceae bacterium AU392]|nr:tetratricopeptide repeat protein [Flavobacteriaceae bacterium]RKM84709.1 tetratricopeptide repeat protein [Flavobacteriaceae bacterium AU392]
MKKIIYIIIFLFSVVTIAQNDALFNVGNDLYNEGKFQDAIKKYEAVIKTGEHSAELYFNIANAYYKLNNTAQSIYYYEKALLLSPNDEDIKNNLAFARNMTIDAIEEIPDIGFSKTMKTITNSFSFDGWAKLSVLLVLLFVVFFLGYYFSFETVRKRIAFLSSVTSLGLMLITLFFAFQKYNYEQKNKPAIVFAQESEIKAEPNLRSEENFKLHEGTKVQVLEKFDNNWFKIKIADGKTGWIPSEDIRLLNAF